MATYNKFNVFVEDQFEGVHDWDLHTFKVMLTNSAPVATNSVRADLTEISAGNGYTAGGTATTITTSRSTGTFKAEGTDVVFTASGGTATTITTSRSGGTFKAEGTDVVFTATGAVGPFRYAVLYNDTPTSPADPLVAWWEYPSTSITLASGETFTVDFDPTNGIFQAA